jgi:hypothetical protein
VRVRVCRGRVSRVAAIRCSRDLGVGRAELRTFLVLFSGGLGLGARGFFRAQNRHTGRFRALRFGRRGLLLSGNFGGNVGRSGFRRGVLLGSGLDVSRLAASANRRVIGHDFGHRRHFDGDGCGRPTAPSCRRGRGLLFGADALFPLPPGTNASDLVVGEHTHVASDRNVHEPKKADHFFGGYSELGYQLTD